MYEKKKEDCSPESGPGLPVPAPGSERPASRPVISTFLLCTRYPVYVCVFSPVRLSATPWTAARQAPLSRDFPDKDTGVAAIFYSRGPSQPAFQTCISRSSCRSWRAHSFPLCHPGNPGCGMLLQQPKEIKTTVDYI